MVIYTKAVPVISWNELNDIKGDEFQQPDYYYHWNLLVIQLFRTDIKLIDSKNI